MQNFGNLAFVNYEGIYRFLDAQTYEKEKNFGHRGSATVKIFDQEAKIDRRIRDRRHKQV
jgi:hypothetical protein